MAEYLTRSLSDGLSEDPWVRTHARLGAGIVKICPTSMTITGALLRWRFWTGQSGARGIEGWFDQPLANDVVKAGQAVVG